MANQNTQEIFARMVEEMHAMAETSDLLDPCLGLNVKGMKQIPLRYRLIAQGFAEGISLERLQRRLEEHRCPKLYSRSMREATLIFAFKNHWSYPRWRELYVSCGRFFSDGAVPAYFADKKITLAELRRYVRENSLNDGSRPITRQLTKVLEHRLLEMGDSEKRLRAFFEMNAEDFSEVREKTRYYFCKYLCYFLDSRIADYFAACRKDRGIDEALSGMLGLKVVTALRRAKTMPEQHKRALIEGSAISCGELFDEFNYFYFEYASLDWVSIILECYEQVDAIPKVLRKRLADLFRKRDRKYRFLSDERVITAYIREEEARADMDDNKGYGRNRSGEHALYNYIKGTLDIDRTVLICFLLFFAAGARMPEKERLTPTRMTEILSRCGYAVLHPEEDDFDWFVTEFLESRKPMQLLEDVVLEAARRSENSFVYHLYAGSTSNAGEITQIFG